MGNIVFVGLCHLQTFLVLTNSSLVFYGTISFIDNVFTEQRPGLTVPSGDIMYLSALRT